MPMCDDCLADVETAVPAKGFDAKRAIVGAVGLVALVGLGAWVFSLDTRKRFRRARYVGYRRAEETTTELPSTESMAEVVFGRRR